MKHPDSQIDNPGCQRAGLLPWAIEAHYRKLVDAFREKDSVAVVRESAVMSHYAGDSHVPFHCLTQYDGCTPEQKGIHFRWEENLVVLTVKPQS